MAYYFPLASHEQRGAIFEKSEWTFTHREENPVVRRDYKRWSSMSKILSVQVQLSETTNNLYVVTCDVSSRELCCLAKFESNYYHYQLHHFKTKDQKR